MYRIPRLGTAAVFVAITFALGCAPSLRHSPTTFSPTRSATPRAIVVQQQTEVVPSWGYKRTLKAGSVWNEVGTVSEGTVYKIESDVFMLEAAHMHEAYCVISGDTLVGFFLPFEQAFVTVSEKTSLLIKSK